MVTQTSSYVLGFLVLIVCLQQVHAIEWLVLGNRDIELDWNSTETCDIVPGFVSERMKNVCKRNLDAMPGIIKAARLAVKTCKEQMSDQRWGCNSITSAPNFNPDLAKDTRQRAYLRALSSAVITYTIAHECSLGSIARCRCDKKDAGYTPMNNMESSWWGNCSDFIKFGMEFSARFTDSKTINYIDLHNNRVGRLAVKQSARMYCKCHGNTGSCTIKTCWERLPRMRHIGLELKEKYSEAIEVIQRQEDDEAVYVPRYHHSIKYDKIDLIYRDTHDYCTNDTDTGVPEVVGRLCNQTTIGNHMQYNWCDLMCCGRGYRQELKKVEEDCRCQYRWCCHVKCEKCTRIAEINICK